MKVTKRSCDVTPRSKYQKSKGHPWSPCASNLVQFRLLFTKLRHFEKNGTHNFSLIGRHLESVSRTIPVFKHTLAQGRSLRGGKGGNCPPWDFQFLWFFKLIIPKSNTEIATWYLLRRHCPPRVFGPGYGPALAPSEKWPTQEISVRFGPFFIELSC